MLVVFLSKSEQEKWAGVTQEDVRASEARKPKVNSEDPSAGMMDLMKQMYEDGDDKMKQVWSDVTFFFIKLFLILLMTRISLPVC